MNNNADFTNLRSILKHADSHIERLDKLQFFCGYQTQITDITDRVRKLLRDTGYFAGDNYNANTDEAANASLRRIVFFLLLNTTIPLADAFDLQNDDAVVHLLLQNPAMPPFLVLHMLWSLNMHQFLCEALAMTPSWYAVEFLGQAVVSLKSSTVPELNRAMRAARFVVATVQNVARTASTHIDERWPNVCLEMVREFLTANEESTAGMRNPRRSKYLGYVMKHSLEAAQACIRTYQNVDGERSSVDGEAQRVFGILNPRTEAALLSGAQRPAHDANDPLRQMIMGQLTAIQTTAMMISLEVYLEWADWDIDDELTMQRHIGESAHGLLQLLNGDTSLKHDVTAQLTSIARQPKTLATVISESNLGEIMSKLDSVAFIEPEIRRMWLTEFVQRGVLVFGNDECMDTLEANVQAFTEEHIAMLIEAVHGLHGQLDDSGDRLRKLLIGACERQSYSVVLRMLAKSVELNPPKGVDLELDTFSGDATRLVNICTARILRTSHTLSIMLQNIGRFVEATLTAALKTMHHHIEIRDFYDTVPHDLVRPFVQQTLNGMVGRYEQMHDDERALLAQLLVTLFRIQFVTGAAFLQYIYRTVCESSAADRLQTLMCMLNTLKCFLHHMPPDGGCGGDDDITGCVLWGMSGPLLVMCAAVMDTYRWDMYTYSEQRVQIVELAVELMHDLRHRFLPVAKPEDREFIMSKLTDYKPLTRFYFQRFGLAREQQPIEFAAFICPAVADESVASASLLESLLGAIARCTRKECAMLAQNAQLRPYWFLAIALMARVIGSSTTVDATGYACLRNAAQSLAHVVHVNFVAAAAVAEEKWMLLINYMKLLRRLETMPNYDDLFMDAHYVILELLAGVKRQGLGLDGDEEQQKYIQKRAIMQQCLVLMRDCCAKLLVVRALE